MIRLPFIARLANKNNISLISTVPGNNHQFYSKDSRTPNSSSSSSSSSSSDDEKKPKKQVPSKSDEALKKLNILLAQMVEENIEHSKTKLDLAKPKRARDIRNEEETHSVEKETVEGKMVNAVKDVAQTIGGNVKQTESELLSKLLNTSKEGEEPQKTEALNLSDIIKGMKIDREKKAPEDKSRAAEVKQFLQTVRDFKTTQRKSAKSNMPRKPLQTGTRDVTHRRLDLFGATPLGIFINEKDSLTEEVKCKTWDKLYERDLQLAVTHPPSNYFQQMILWTEQGKIWKFPIDNEQGMEDEQNVYFAEHVFLERHLESWCPHKGPIRHFMELVCVGLSKNPYLTVEKKKEHIDWYKKYFEDKQTLLKEVGAIPADSKTSVNDVQ